MSMPRNVPGARAEVRASYNRTELGMIPEDWGIEGNLPRLPT